MNTSSRISSVPLYLHPERVEEELAAKALGPEAELTVDQVAPFDQMHYYGNISVAGAVGRLGLRPGSRVIDIGSGFGGPARYLAQNMGCLVTAIELQSAIHAAAVQLTQRCGLSHRVAHVCADALDYSLPDATYDAVVGWLAILHIADRPRLLARIARALRAGGSCYIEDCIRQTSVTKENLNDLASFLYGPSLSGIAEYETDLAAAGFRDIEATDVTENWARFAATRLVAFESDRARYVRVHGVPAYDALRRFYSEIVRFYDIGTLGGIRIVARLP
jgi:cyclopropane fatty-acyl-phospholipid synthase-like methyltransferase